MEMAARPLACERDSGERTAKANKTSVAKRRIELVPAGRLPYPRRSDLERRPLPMSPKPAKPISSIAMGGISGTVPDCAPPMLTNESPASVPAGETEFRLTPGLSMSDAGANEPSTGEVTLQHAGGKVPWITPDGQVMAKLLCAAIIWKPKFWFVPPPKGEFEPGRYGRVG
jgi:hypothetical protein